MVWLSSGLTANPSAAHLIAAAAMSAKRMVPWRSSAVIQASGAAGTTVRNTPDGISPAAWKRSAGRLIGQWPRPAMVSSVPSAMRRMMGATPATLTRSGSSTPRARPAAQPASTALPPASSTAKPEAAAR